MLGPLHMLAGVQSAMALCGKQSDRDYDNYELTYSRSPQFLSWDISQRNSYADTQRIKILITVLFMMVRT